MGKTFIMKLLFYFFIPSILAQKFCKWRVYYGEYSMNEQVGNATTVEDCAKECKDNFECKGFNLFQNKCSTFTEIKSKKKASSDMYIWICDYHWKRFKNTRTPTTKQVVASSMLNCLHLCSIDPTCFDGVLWKITEKECYFSTGRNATDDPLYSFFEPQFSNKDNF